MRHLVVASAFGAVAERIERFFSHRGYRVEVVGCGVECLGSLKRTVPDALVLDWNLPWGGGAGVLACLREAAATAKVPVVLLADRFSSDLDVDAPVRQCLKAPTDVESLYDAVDSALGARTTGPRFKFQPARR